jgi:LmbE family N-acetylglucosaminyl deacetylase
MITPLVDEISWLMRLDDLPAWTPPLLHTVVIAPHPDDETLGAGGLIAHLRSQSIDVTILAVTDGENAYADNIDIRATREREQTTALAHLGVPASSIHRLHLPDSAVTDREEALTDLLLPYITPTTHVLAPWPHDFHPDHEACGRAAKKVAALHGARLTSYLFWTWHRAPIDFLDNLPLVSLALAPAERRAKIKALQAHQSQLHHASGHPILPDYLLGPAYRSFEVYIPS